MIHKHKEIILAENTLEDKIKVVVEVKEHSGNITFLNILNKIREAVFSFPDIKELKKQEKEKRRKK